MQFFSGFSLQKEEHFFDELIDTSDYNICGFSYGAIKAFQHTKKLLDEGKRVDRLQLFSPAFFQTKSEKFKRLQLLSFSKSQEKYLEQFIASCFSPYEKQVVQHSSATITQLEELLHFEWSVAELVELENKGVSIEVYLGAKDKIIDVNGAREFFLDVATVTYIKEANHFLQTK